MSNVGKTQLKRVPIQFGETNLMLRFDLFGFAKLEEEYGTLQGAFDALQDKPISGLINAVYAFGISEQPDLKKEDLGKGVGFSEIKDLISVIEKNVTDSMPGEKEVTEEPEVLTNSSDPSLESKTKNKKK